MTLASQLQRRCVAALYMARSPCAPSQNQPHVLKAVVGDNFGQEQRAIFHNIFHCEGIFANSKDHSISETHSQFRCQKEKYEKVVVG